MVNLTLRVPAPLLEALEEIAIRDLDTAPNILRTLLRNYVRENRLKDAA